MAVSRSKEEKSTGDYLIHCIEDKRHSLYRYNLSSINFMNSTPAMRLRATFSKTMAMRYTGHLDVQRAWERALRRASLPLAYSQGFKPHPKLNLTAPLPRIHQYQ